MVLIETSWNVKIICKHICLTCEPCINRNIVECKAGSKCHIQLFNLVLIETSWNVKLIEASARSVPVPSINRNIVECKADKKIEIAKKQISY